MNIWCPECGSTSFYNDKIEETESPTDQLIVKDKMKCKKCAYEFTIEWYSYVREEWLREAVDFRIQKFKKRIRGYDNN